jgi:hypothetical protein
VKHGDFYGEETLLLESGHLSVEVLADAGPRIVRLALAGSSENVLGEVADVGWDTPWGRYNLHGGHRLWCAPENPPLTSAPDEGDLLVEERPHGIRLERREPQTGLRKSMEIELAGDRAALTIGHGVRNEGDEPVELAPWAITIMPLGGVAILPQQKGPVGESEVLPNRSLILWPYSSVTDPRLELGDELVLVHAVATETPFKVGYLDRAGWSGYLRGELLFCKHFDPQPERDHADLGSNAEVYCNDRTLELETLAPLVRLEPGHETGHRERWELHLTGEVESSAERLAALLAELGLAT